MTAFPVAGVEFVRPKYAPTLAPVLALDIGGTKLAVGVVTPDGKTHGLLIEPTRRDEGPDTVVRRLFEMGHRSIHKASLGREIGAVGISCGGPLDARQGILLCPPHLPGWVNIAIGDMTRNEFRVPVALENDATAAALGEFHFGAGRSSRSLVYLTISTGVGGGAVFDGLLHRGSAGNGGELGHIIVRPNGRQCTCPRRGCLEAYCSGTAIGTRGKEAVREAKASGRTTSLAALHNLTAADIAREAAAGDEVATEVWNLTTDLLSQAATDLVNVFEPDLLVLGGGVTRAGEMLIAPVRKAVAEQAMKPAAKAVSVVLAALGDVVGVVGAGALAFELLEA